MKYKLIFIGNSIVAGYPWSKGKSFVGILRKTLKGEGPLPQPSFAKSTGFDVINKGENGDTTAGISARYKYDVLDHNPDVIFILTGTNDFIYRDATPEDAFANLELMADQAQSCGAVPVYMTPLPVDAGKAEYMWMAGCGISYDAVNRDIDKVADMIRRSGKLFVDTHEFYMEYYKKIGDPDLVYLDGLHPMPAGHEYIAAEVLKFIEENMTKLGLR